jgi:hypothetical protein
MNKLSSQYIFGSLFIAVGIYQLVIKDYLEFYLYALAGATFIINALSMEPKLLAYKKPLAILSWLLIIGTGVLFLWMLQFKYLN